MKKVLIITYYWPPSGGGGVQRWLKFAKYLPEYGWEPVIFTPENPDFDIQDEALLKEISDDLEVIKLPIWEPYQLFEKFSGKKTPSQGLLTSNKKKSLLTNLALWVRGNFFIPDPRKFWIKPSVNFLCELLEQNNIDTIVTTGPPHSMHLIGLGLKKKSNIRWIADFRDPWSNWDMLDNFKMTSIARKRHEKLELEVLKQADEVITVSNTWASEFNDIYPRPYKVITNGYDEDDFKEVSTNNNEDKFIISHFGLINNFRNPANLWIALKEIALIEKIEIRLYGMIEPSILNMIQSDPLLKQIVDVRPSISHTEVIQAYADSDLLLLLLNNSENANGHIPGKLFEYLASNRPIIALGPKDGDAARIIDKTGAGLVYNWNDVDIKVGLNDFIHKTKTISTDKDKITSYSRRNLTKALVENVLN